MKPGTPDIGRFRLPIPIQSAVDPRLRGRVMSLDSTVNHGVPAVGALRIGWAGVRFGEPVPLAAAGAAGLVLLAPGAGRMARCRDELEGGFSDPKNASSGFLFVEHRIPL